MAVVMSDMQSKQETLRKELVKVGHYLNFNHLNGFISEGELTKVGDSMVVDVSDTPKWAALNFTPLGLSHLLRNALCEYEIESYHSEAHAENIVDNGTNPPVDLRNGLACFTMTVSGTHNIKVAGANPTSGKVMVVRNDVSSNDGSRLHLLLSDTIFVSVGSDTANKGFIELKPDHEVVLWGRADTKWFVIRVGVAQKTSFLSQVHQIKTCISEMTTLMTDNNF